MQSMNQRFNPAKSGLTAFDFAGFHWPRFVAVLPKGSKAKRLEQYKAPLTGPYSHAPKPVNLRTHKGQSFYLGQHGQSGFGQPGLRWEWCDEVEDASIKHTGWFTTEFGSGDKIRGMVFTLPHSRGFLAGWSMGEGMASVIDCELYTTAGDAAYAADSLAEDAAEEQREFEAAQAEGEDE